jgi:hypothetical protein
MFDVSSTDARAFYGWGPAAIPDPRDAEVAMVVSELCEGGPSLIEVATALASDPGRDVLGCFAERMASAAVRNRDRELLVKALVADRRGGDRGRPRLRLWRDEHVH